jgi:ubiquinone/menaquinone biosynthesis C-methylase UbiE
VEGSALGIPYPDADFDLVFTSGLLIHIAPNDLVTAMSEIYRCSTTWIGGLEYYAPEMTEVSYRDRQNLMWKTDYARLYLKNFADLELVLEEKVPYLKDGNVDPMFLLRRLGQNR